MTNSMKVSVVIPAYNEEKYIRKCLESIAQQIEKPDEVIVVDNNCIDNTVEIAQKFRAIIVKEKKQGMIHARNAGFDAAQYEIIARTDADAILPSDWILKIKEHFKNQSLGALSGPSYYYNLPKKLQVSQFPSLYFFKIISFLIKTDCLFGPNMILKKSVWEKVRKEVCLNDKKVHEDIDLTIHIRKYTKIKFDSKLIVRTTRTRWGQISTEYAVRLIRMLYFHRHLR